MSQARSRRVARSGSSALVEMLEGRRLLSADPLTVVIGAGAAKSVQFTDANGTQAQILLKGAGSASVVFDGDGLTQSANARGVIVKGTGVTLTSIAASATNATSTLQIITHGKHTLSVGSITAGGALNGLLAPGVSVTGDVTTSAGLHQLQLAGASGGTISVGSGKVGTLSVKVGSVSNESLNSAIPIVSLAASQWVNTLGGGQTITASQIKSIIIAHDLSADITTGSVNTINVHGSLSDCTINLTTPLTARGMNANQLSVGGAILTATINSGGSLGAIVAGRIQDSQIYAGLVASPSAPLPTATTDFRNTAQIKSIVLHRSASASLANSNIAAYTIGATNLGAVPQSNGGTPFGLAAHQMTSVTIVDQGSGKSVHVSKPATTTSFQSALTAKGVTPGDFEVRIV